MSQISTIKSSMKGQSPQKSAGNRSVTFGTTTTSNNLYNKTTQVSNSPSPTSSTESNAGTRYVNRTLNNPEVRRALQYPQNELQNGLQLNNRQLNLRQNNRQLNLRQNNVINSAAGIRPARPSTSTSSVVTVFPLNENNVNNYSVNRNTLKRKQIKNMKTNPWPIIPLGKHMKTSKVMQNYLINQFNNLASNKFTNQVSYVYVPNFEGLGPALVLNELKYKKTNNKNFKKCEDEEKRLITAFDNYVKCLKEQGLSNTNAQNMKQKLNVLIQNIKKQNDNIPAELYNRLAKLRQ